MISAEKMADLIMFAFLAHGNQSRTPEKAFRKMDGKTPYSAHLLWCATTILAEPTLPEELRELGFQVLLFHDLLEDTFAELPSDVSAEVVELVKGMTFKDTEDEQANLWSRGDRILLFKLYDKTHNLMDRHLLPEDKRLRNATHALRIATEVEKTYASLNITRLCRTLCADIA